MKKQFGKTIGFAFLVSLFVFCVATASAVASDDSDEAKIQRAMKAAPSSISAHARILDAEWNELRPATEDNEWTCFPGVPLIDGDKHPMCNDAVWMEWLEAVIVWAENGYDIIYWSFDTTTIGYSYMLRGDALVNNGNPAAEPGDLGIWDQEGPHLMLLYPDSIDLPSVDSPYDGGPYVMWGGTPMVHIMVPLTDRDR
jgi:hypothetical protein